MEKLADGMIVLAIISLIALFYVLFKIYSWWVLTPLVIVALAYVIGLVYEDLKG